MVKFAVGQQKHDKSYEELKKISFTSETKHKQLLKDTSFTKVIGNRKNQ